MKLILSDKEIDSAQQEFNQLFGVLLGLTNNPSSITKRFPVFSKILDTLNTEADNKRFKKIKKPKI